MERDMNRKYHVSQLYRLKKELLDEKVRAYEVVCELIANQNNIIKLIKNEKKVMRDTAKEIREDGKIRVIQGRHTQEFFREIVKYLEDVAFNSISNKASINVYSKSDEGKVNPYFQREFINLDLLHSLCYRKGIYIYVSVDDNKGLGIMNFSIDANRRINTREYNDMLINNVANMEYFYNYYVKGGKSNAKRKTK